MTDDVQVSPPHVGGYTIAEFLEKGLPIGRCGCWRTLDVTNDRI